MITVIVSMEAAPGQTEAFRTRLGALLARVREEPGCRGIYWGTVLGEAHRFTVVERYADRAALEAHHSSPHMAELGPHVMALCAGAPTASLFEEF